MLYDDDISQVFSSDLYVNVQAAEFVMCNSNENLSRRICAQFCTKKTFLAIDLPDPLVCNCIVDIHVLCHYRAMMTQQLTLLVRRRLMSITFMKNCWHYGNHRAFWDCTWLAGNAHQWNFESTICAIIETGGWTRNEHWVHKWWQGMWIWTYPES